MKIKKYTSSIRVYFFTIFFPAFIISPSANAELYQWWVFPYGEAGRGFPDPVSACEWVYSLISINWKKKMEPGKGSEKGKVLHCTYTGNGVYWEVISAVLRGSACPAGASLNNETGRCDCRPGYEMDDSGCKLPDKNGPEKGPPPPEGCAGNPVNITNGNKYQVEHDLSIPIPLSRYYNGLDGLWRHSYSARITRKDDSFLLYRENGKVSEFTGSGKYLTSITDLGRLSRLPGKFSYTSELNEVMEFDQNGILTKLTTKEGRKYRVERGANLTISDERGNKLVLSEGTNHQLLRAQTGGISIEYTYDKEQRLTSVTRTDGQYSTKTQYLYDDPRNGKLLTGILDNNNRRFATWTYDDQGRAISSEHANGAEKVTLAYNDDGSTTVTNEYGKQATYRFQVIQGIKRIVAIEGEPSPNCPSSNSTFTYDERGLLSSKRDNNGNLTTYQYSARGLETSRTEAAGTAQARTITTDWHPTLFLPVQVSEPGRITRYQYDAEGRKTGETVTTR
ncbi:DUF6531 domain-containing protein [Pseudomonas aeruginosa]|uniref:DUF6531 domain-containing protein n=9 Tax=Pseudomonas aeruginosa TaxID=287 RepID=UPI001CC1C398|nr:DUF6531 domain-containing protein [Pseudomonas aeruginosa]MDG3694011.1 DUF6531 domain-containing protein [Pseudomonas aeruginosa]MDG3958299.1 DUF6531 domain-containing protein [Pseudomonas aeruginosa]MDH0298238.1 DUF6531 domain-containing protein [Pseudomonas aeruginosa]MDH0378621.1 DUF6531 domain-containing protein [Pseudomonas aeruginosa]MDH1327216.1 DUF6531 domain-containing protein [Pseudomonas aeruginosa]